jgi:hypothetical protein
MEKISCKLNQGEYKLVRETKLKSVIWQTFDYIFDGDEKLKDVVGCFMCKKKCVPTQDTNPELQTSSSTNVKLAKRTSPVSSQI